jgi:hypothetical protein
MSASQTNRKLMLQMDKWKDGSVPKVGSGVGGGPGVDGRPRPFAAGGYATSRNGKGVFYKKKERGISIQAIKLDEARRRASRKK